jgi:cell division septum initiation protein DivIVA
VSLDRQSIEKRDFPIGRRGYEPEAVDAHLAEIAAQVAELQQQSRRKSGDSLASAASDQVRLIVQAAESSAAGIEQEARDDAARIRDEATGDAERTRHEAIEKSTDHVARVDEASTLMLQRVDAMESELTALTESLRTGANRLKADLTLLQGNMGELYDASGGGDAPTPARPVPPTPVAAAVDTESERVEEEADFEAAPEVVEVVEVEEVEIVASTGGADDVEGARLVALDMALGGSTREETDRYLAEHYDLSDRAGLLDEVFATVEG